MFGPPLPVKNHDNGGSSGVESIYLVLGTYLKLHMHVSQDHTATPKENGALLAASWGRWEGVEWGGVSIAAHALCVVKPQGGLPWTWYLNFFN